MRGQIYPYRNGFMVRFGRGISKWFKTREQAERMLTGLRFAVDQGTFDPRDYAADRPLSFENLAEAYLEHKEQIIKPKSYANLENYLARAMKAWGGANIKAIGYAEIEDFLFSQNVSDKTKANIRSCLHDFWTWLRKRRIITLAQFPEFPEVKYELGYRNIIEIDTQQAIIAEVKRITRDVNPKIWLGIRWLSIYIALRPGELIGIQEKHINRDGVIIVPHTKDGKPKTIFLLDDDIELLNAMPRGLPDLFFFRHPAGISGCKAGQKFGNRYLYKYWMKACNNLGIQGVDMYGGTRHSTASALSSVLSPDEIKIHGTQHSTNKAFERYFQRKARDSLKVSSAVTVLQQVYNQKDNDKGGKVLK
ncbi:MAG: hypothetical protein B6I22_14660, partial [Desulfobacteraceae bacterium 4572_123]